MVVLRPAVPGGSSRDPRHLKDTLRRWAPTHPLRRAGLLVRLLLVAAMLLGRAGLGGMAGPVSPRAGPGHPPAAPRRLGGGGERAGVRGFGPGDRLRRMAWRVSLRTRELHVAATLSDRDAEVVLVLDVLHEAGRSGGINGARSVLDTTVRAAAGIAEHYLHRGDRVALLEYGFRARRLRAGGGRRHYHTVLEWLLGVSAAGRRVQT